VLLVVLGGTSLALLSPPVVEADRPLTADVPMPVFAAYRGQDLLAHLTFRPGQPGTNTFRVYLTNYDRSPFSGDQPALVRFRFASLGTAADVAPVEARLTPEGWWTIDRTQASIAGWWRVEVTLRWPGQTDVVVPFYLLLPDPNLNGFDAPATPPDQSAGVDLYGRAMAVYTGMHRVRYIQAMASNTGTVSYGVHAVNDGSDGSTPGFTYDALGRWQYVVLGTTGWSRTPGEDWSQQEVNPMIPPAEWGEEYVGATGFRLERVEMAGGEPCQILTFVVPGTPRQVVARDVWWVGTETGRVHREAMISQSHYMVSEFSAFDAPLVIMPPV
jgi:hypothetical protein